MAWFVRVPSSNLATYRLVAPINGAVDFAMVPRFIFLTTLSVSILARHRCNGFAALRTPRLSMRIQSRATAQSQEDGPDVERDGSMAAATKELNFVPYGELVSGGTLQILCILPFDSEAQCSRHCGSSGTGPTLATEPQVSEDCLQA